MTAAAKLVRSRQRAFASAQEAVRQAEEMWRKLREASLLIISRQGLFDTIEPLLAESDWEKFEAWVKTPANDVPALRELAAHRPAWQG